MTETVKESLEKQAKSLLEIELGFPTEYAKQEPYQNEKYVRLEVALDLLSKEVKKRKPSEIQLLILNDSSRTLTFRSNMLNITPRVFTLKPRANFHSAVRSDYAILKFWDNDVFMIQDRGKELDFTEGFAEDKNLLRVLWKQRPAHFWKNQYESWAKKVEAVLFGDEKEKPH